MLNGLSVDRVSKISGKNRKVFPKDKEVSRACLVSRTTILCTLSFPNYIADYDEDNPTNQSREYYEVHALNNEIFDSDCRH